MAKRADDKKIDAGTRQQKLPLTWDDDSAAKQSDLPFEVERPAEASQSPSAEGNAPASPAPEADVEKEVLPETSPLDAVVPSPGADTEPDAHPLPSAGDENSSEEEEGCPAEPQEETDADAEVETEQAGPEPELEDTSPPAEVQIIELGKVEMTLGQRLMEARGACNLTITNVAQKTRIPKHIIEQIETDRVKELPPPIYTRSYVAQLCREYDIDPQPILTELDLLLQRREDDDTHRLVVTAQDSESGSMVQYRLAGKRGTNGNRAITPTMLAVVAAVVALAFLILAALALKQWRRHREKQEVIEAVEVVPMPATPIDLEEFIIPQQLPLKELAIPED